MPQSSRITTFVSLIAAAALACLAAGMAHASFSRLPEFICYLGIAVFASALKVTLPGVDGTLSVNFIFLLLGILELTFAETMILAVAAVLVQSYWHSSKRLKPIQVAFNLSQLIVATTAAFITFIVMTEKGGHRAFALATAATTYFLCNTAAMAKVISLSEGKKMRQTWAQTYSWSYPYYLIGAGVAGFVSYLNNVIGWQTSLFTLPAIYVLYKSYRIHLGKLETDKSHAEEMSRLHFRTIESLALAIEAKDHTTHDHLQRVRVYAMDLAKDLGLTADQTEALRAASLLHDIGKLAVPEHIISKPGKLTPEEFERMKIHPIIGAEILEQVRFPYPVVPIVRSHHEKWDGSGYPDGLKGEEIPIGARILSAVDCLDALASHRQYRPALPLHEAMAKVKADAGTSFDPRVVQVLEQRYVELEKLAHAKESESPARLSVGAKVQRGEAPAAGFEKSHETGSRPAKPRKDPLSSIAGARHEAHLLYELTNDLGMSLRLDDTLSMFSVRLKRLVEYDAMAVYVRSDKLLTAEFVTGDNFRLFSSLRIPVGEGLSGWVAHNNKPIMNGNPSVEPGYLNDPTKFSSLRSALAVPLAGRSEVRGVLALYRASQDAFKQNDLRIVSSASAKLGFTIENALTFKQAEDSATTDFLTGLPNTRSLYLHLESELARCKRSNGTLTVFVLDLDGFKKVNDRFGHMEGNNLLRMFAASLKDSCREYDYAARIGGDEFVVVAPGLAPEGGMEMINRLRAAAVDAGRTIFDGGIVSASVGQASYPEDGEDCEALLYQADQSMYAVKHSSFAQAATQSS